MLEFLNDYMLLVVVGICLCVGYMLKNALPKFPNNMIPATMGMLGVIVAVWCEGTINPDILLTGLISGLASTGLHQTLTKFISKDETVE